MSLNPSSRGLLALTWASWAAFAGILWHACVSPAIAQAPTEVSLDPVTTAAWLVEQLHGGHAGTWIVVGAVFVAVKALRSLGGARFPVLRSPAGGALCGAVVSLAGGLLSMGVAGKPLNLELVTMVLVAWWGAAGSQSTLSDMASLNFTPKATTPVVGSQLP